MTGPVTLEARLRVVKIIHAALMAGVILFLLVAAVMRRRGGAVAAGQLGPVLTYVGLGVLAGALVLVRILPRPDPAPAPGQAADQWWTASQSRLIVLWAVTEGACLLNAMVWFITQARVSLGAAALALAVLFVLRPGRYLE